MAVGCCAVSPVVKIVSEKQCGRSPIAREDALRLLVGEVYVRDYDQRLAH